MTRRTTDDSFAAGASAPEDVGVSITYHTGRLLDALAAYPGASGRQLAFAAGAPYEEHVAELLGSLERLGFASARQSGADGEPDSWYLTGEGLMLQQAVWDGSVEASGAGRGRGGRRARGRRGEGAHGRRGEGAAGL